MNHLMLIFADAVASTPPAPIFSDAVWNNLINSIVGLIMAWIAYRQHDEKTKAAARDVKIDEVADTVKVVSSQVQGVHEAVQSVQTKAAQAITDANSDAI